MGEIEATQQLRRTEVADYLREFADQLDTDDAGDRRSSRDRPSPATQSRDRTDSRDVDGRGLEASDHDGIDDSATTLDDRVTILVGNDSATVNPPDEIGLDITVDDDDSLIGGDAERHVVFDLSWDVEEVENPDVLDIE